MNPYLIAAYMSLIVLYGGYLAVLLLRARSLRGGGDGDTR